MQANIVHAARVARAVTSRSCLRVRAGERGTATRGPGASAPLRSCRKTSLFGGHPPNASVSIRSRPRDPPFRGRRRRAGREVLSGRLRGRRTAHRDRVHRALGVERRSLTNSSGSGLRTRCAPSCRRPDDGNVGCGGADTRGATRGGAGHDEALLFVRLEGARPLAGGARHSLRDIDEVLFGRGPARALTRRGGTGGLPCSTVIRRIWVRAELRPRRRARLRWSRPRTEFDASELLTERGSVCVR